MIKLFKRNKDKDNQHPVVSEPTKVSLPQAEPEVAPKQSLFQRLKSGLQRTRANLGEGLARLFQGKKAIDAALFEEIETQLLQSDVGVLATQKILEAVTAKVQRHQLADSEALFQALQQQMVELLAPVAKPLAVGEKSGKPYVIIMVGINGSGKTTTIGKLAKHFQHLGKSVMLAAGDTFRAAAIEQLQTWGERNNIPVIAQHTGADSASVIYDALQAATARQCDILIADTAGRLHTQHNLMEELKKIIRVIKKIDPEAPHEVMLVLDAGIGQNALQQVTQFNQAIGVSGLCMTKLDGTAKGGILFAVAETIHIPIRFIGVGEGLDDLRPFEAEQFVAALFG